MNFIHIEEEAGQVYKAIVYARKLGTYKEFKGDGCYDEAKLWCKMMGIKLDF